MSLYLGSNFADIGTPYVRPNDWIPMPPITGSQQFWGLLAIHPNDDNYVALAANLAYYVDWGDGVINTGSAGATNYHSYSYESIPSESYCSRGYRQVWVNIVPSGSGVTLTNINLQKKHNKTGLPTIPVVPWLDVYITGSNIVTVTFGGFSVSLYLLEKCYINSGKITNAANMFNACYNLQSVNLFDTSGTTDFTSMFASCYSLKTVPKFNTISASTVASMFNGCYNLQNVPVFDTSNATNFSSMFNNCYNLQNVPLFDTSKGTNFTTMFNACYSLNTIPLLNTQSGSTFTNMFQNCNSLQSIPQLNTSTGSNFTGMFANCFALQSIPLLDTSKGILFTSMFSSCASLVNPPPLNTAAGLTGSAFTNMFLGAKAMRFGALSGSTYTINYSDKNLSRDAIVSIFNNLGTAAANQSISCSLNHGVADLTAADIQIATDKGWTVLT